MKFICFGLEPRKHQAAGRVPRRSLMRGAATNAATRTSILLLSCFSFLFFMDSLRLDSNSRQLGFDLLRFGLIQAKLGRFG